MLELIRTAGIFMIVTQTMYHFVSGSKYARYVRLLIRIMTLAVLIVPLLELMKSGTEADFYERLAAFEQEYETVLREAENAGEAFVEEAITQRTVQELIAAVDPVLAAYGYETVSVSADESGLLFVLRRIAQQMAPLPAMSSDAPPDGQSAGKSDSQTTGIYVSPVREVRVQMEPQTGVSDGEAIDAGLADVIADCLGIERSWVEVKVVG